MKDKKQKPFLETKLCTKCGNTKPIDGFHKGASYCKECRSRYSKEHPEVTRKAQERYREIHKEEINKRQRDNYDSEKARLYWEKYAASHRDQLREARKRKYYENHEKSKERGRKWHNANKEKCAVTYAKWKRENPDVIKDHWADTGKRKRALLKSVKVEIFKAEEIYERDGWICQLCRKKVNKKLRFPDPLSRSLDHIIPLSLGGTHERKNVQLTHYKCNVEIKTGGIKQLRMFG